jgi:hypothetical protein
MWKSPVSLNELCGQHGGRSTQMTDQATVLRCPSSGRVSGGFANQMMRLTSSRGQHIRGLSELANYLARS